MLLLLLLLPLVWSRRSAAGSRVPGRRQALSVQHLVQALLLLLVHPARSVVGGHAGRVLLGLLGPVGPSNRPPVLLLLRLPALVHVGVCVSGGRLPLPALRRLLLLRVLVLLLLLVANVCGRRHGGHACGSGDGSGEAALALDGKGCGAGGCRVSPLSRTACFINDHSSVSRQLWASTRSAAEQTYPDRRHGLTRSS